MKVTTILVVSSIVAVVLVITEQYWFQKYPFLKPFEIIGVLPVIRGIIAWVRNDPDKDW